MGTSSGTAQKQAARTTSQAKATRTRQRMSPRLEQIAQVVDSGHLEPRRSGWITRRSSHKSPASMTNAKAATMGGSQLAKSARWRRSCRLRTVPPAEAHAIVPQAPDSSSDPT